jgi:hypothetical protein
LEKITILTGIILAGQGFQVFGPFERITIGSYEVWVLVTAWRLLKLEEFELIGTSKPTRELLPKLAIVKLK